MGLRTSTHRSRSTSSARAENTDRSGSISVNEVFSELRGCSASLRRLRDKSETIQRNRQIFVLADLVHFVDADRALEISDSLIERFGSIGSVLSAANQSLVEDACEPALANILACARAAMMESLHEDVRRSSFDISDNRTTKYLVSRFKELRTETLISFFLDSGMNYIVDETDMSGTFGSIDVSIRKILRVAVSIGSSNIVLSHNHPSGNPRPSKSDMVFTTLLNRACNTLGINIVDHIIVSGTKLFSMRSAGLIS